MTWCSKLEQTVLEVTLCPAATSFSQHDLTLGIFYNQKLQFAFLYYLLPENMKEVYNLVITSSLQRQSDQLNSCRNKSTVRFLRLARGQRGRRWQNQPDTLSPMFNSQISILSVLIPGLSHCVIYFVTHTIFLCAACSQQPKRTCSPVNQGTQDKRKWSYQLLI